VRPDVFVSDVHLAPERPALTRAFLHFLEHEAIRAGRLFILGDLFDHWIGDDDAVTPLNAQVLAAIARLRIRGCDVHLMHGNRDFLIGAACAQAMGATLIDDPHVIETAGARTLLAHGDAYCTRDEPYQRFRTMVRSPAWQADFLARSLAERRRIAQDLRARSEETKRSKPASEMDVDPAAVESALRTSGCDRMIHGHTHLPACHCLTVDGRTCERWVLPDWREEHCAYLRCGPTGCEVVATDASALLWTVAPHRSAPD